MNGSKYLFDTNAIIAYLKGSSFINSLVDDSDWLGISVISIMEFYSFKHLSQIDKVVFSVFCSRVEIIDISIKNNLALIFQTSAFRVKYNLKLPDAVIGASAIINDATVITNDTTFQKVSSLKIFTF